MIDKKKTKSYFSFRFKGRSQHLQRALYQTTLNGWATTLDLRNRETEGHSIRVTAFTLRMAEFLGIPSSFQVFIERGALLHDVGKIRIPDQILMKAGPLSESEWELMRKHPDFGHEWLAPLSELAPCVEIPWCHHERWDGSGYPRGLKGEEIPISARIFSIVDTWDTLRCDRPYRPAWSEKEVRQHLEEQSGRSFDPALIQIFLDHIAE